MVKRITYLTRRADVTPGQFSAHWSTTHAEIARDLPGVIAYRQNHIEWFEPDDEARILDVDGIVELWFEDAETASAGFGSEIADRLIVDERNFLSGLTGASVEGPAPGPLHPFVLWLLWPSVDRDRSVFKAAVTGFAARVQAEAAQVDWLQPDAPVLWRAGLRRQALPAVAAALSFATRAAAQTAADAARGCEAFLGCPQRAVSESKPII